MMDKKVLEILTTAILGMNMENKILSDEERDYLTEWLDNSEYEDES